MIDKDGKVVAALEGYDGPDDRLEAAIRAASASLQGHSATAPVDSTSVTASTR